MKPELIPHLVRHEILFDAVRSRGPGGQNVNKVSSAAILIWPFELSLILSEEQKNVLRSKLHSHINAEGNITLRSDEFRDLPGNKRRCLEKLQELVVKAFHRPKMRKPTRPTRSSQEKRISEKKRKSQHKEMRKKVDY